MHRSLRAIIFDFNGVISDDEPIHLEVLRRVLAEEGIAMSDEDYFTKYLGRDDRLCFTTALVDAGRPRPTPETLERLIARKASYYLEAISGGAPLFPGVADLIRRLSPVYPLAIASGALRAEIEAVLAQSGLGEHFRAVISSEDVSRSKPDPEIFLSALSSLNRTLALAQPIEPRECLVIEDSLSGIEAARRAGMRALAVTTSFPAHALAAADWVVESLDGFDPSSLALTDGRPGDGNAELSGD